MSSFKEIYISLIIHYRLIEHGYVNLDKIARIRMESMDIIGRTVGLPIQDMIRLANGAQELRTSTKRPKINTAKWKSMVRPATKSTQSIGRCF